MFKQTSITALFANPAYLAEKRLIFVSSFCDSETFRSRSVPTRCFSVSPLLIHWNWDLEREKCVKQDLPCSVFIPVLFLGGEFVSCTCCLLVDSVLRRLFQPVKHEDVFAAWMLFIVRIMVLYHDMMLPKTVILLIHEPVS